MESYIHKQDIMHKNAQLFNEDCERFDSALEAFENDFIPQSAWDSIVPSTTEHGVKSYIDGMRHRQKLHGYRVFLSGSGGTGKSHVLQLIQ